MGGGSLIRYSSKTAEQNFMKLSGIVHYMMPYWPPILSFYLNDFGVSQSKTRTFSYKTWGSGGIILWALFTVFLVSNMIIFEMKKKSVVLFHTHDDKTAKCNTSLTILQCLCCYWPRKIVHFPFTNHVTK